MTIEFTIPGKAQPAGSKRGFPVKRKNGTIGVAISDANPKSKSWQHAVRAAATEAYQGPLLEGALSISVIFYRVRPKGHYGSGKKSTELKASAPAYPTTKPDATKLLRGLEDSLSGQVWRDDAQIVNQSVMKAFGEPARVVVRIQSM